MSSREPARFIFGNRGSHNLRDINNFTYIRWRKKSDTIVAWKCSQFRANCTATAQTVIEEDGSEYFYKIPDVNRHNCTVNIDKLAAKALLQETLENAVENKTVKPRQLFADMTKEKENIGVSESPISNIDTFR